MYKALLVSLSLCFFLATANVQQIQSCVDNEAYCSLLAFAACRTANSCDSTCTNNRCVAGSQNCSGPTPYCTGILAPFNCVECTTAAQCVAKNSSKPFCVAGSCVECQNTLNCITKSDCGATCRQGVCLRTNNTNCTSYPYGNCLLDQNLGTYSCSGECTPDSNNNGQTNTNACPTLYGGKKNFCVSNVTSGLYNCVGCENDGDCRNDEDCQATCDVASGTCIASNISSANCTNQSLFCTGNGCTTCTQSSQCVLKFNNPFAVCTRNRTNNNLLACFECSQGGGGTQQAFAGCYRDTSCTQTCTNGVCVNGVNCTANAARPHCRTGTCAECAVDAHCTNSSKPFCGQGGVCAQCSSNAQCTGCNAACNNGLCTNADCAPGYYCQNGGCRGIYNGCPIPCDNSSFPFCDTTNTPRCVECLDDVNCISKTGDCTATCNKDTFTCVAGNNITSCNGSTPVCSVNAGRCVECNSNNDCQNASKPFCDNNNNQPSYTCKGCTQDSQCISGSNCGAGAVCNLTSFTCVEGGCNCTNNTVSRLCRVQNGYYCVECLSNSDCTAAAPICLTQSLFTCVQCSSNDQCRSTQNCNAVCQDNKCTNLNASAIDCTVATGNPSAVCNNGVCTECAVDGDCAGVSGRTYCNTRNGRCVECTGSASCRSDTKCNALCFNNTCAAPSTSDTLNCATTGQKCSTAAGTCAACNANSDCTSAPNLFCDAGVCGECQTAAHCQTASRCNAYCASGKCILPSNTTALDCAANGQVCVPTQVTNPNQASNPLSLSGTCKGCAGEFCQNATNPYCVQGVCSACRPTPANQNDPYFDCRVDTDCNATCVKNTTTNSYQCSAGGLDCGLLKCYQAAGACFECFADTDCATGKVCNIPLSQTAFRTSANIGKCVTCTTNNQCNTNSSCGALCAPNGTCVRTFAKDCTADGAFCRNGACVDCLVSADCPNGQPCNNQGICGLCSSTTQCKSDSLCSGVICSGGKCLVNQSEVLNCAAQSKKCDFTNNKCIQCAGDSDCSGSTPFCNAGTCVACKTDAACRSTSNCNAVCDSVNFRCVNPNAVVGCGSQVCNTATGRCSECASTADCDSAEQCGRTCSNSAFTCGGPSVTCSGQTPFCSGAKCVQCKVKEDCADGQTCSGTNKCVACTPLLCPVSPPSFGLRLVSSLLVFALVLAALL